MIKKARYMKDTLTQFVRLGIIILVIAFALFWADQTWFAPRRLPPCVQEQLPEGRICMETLIHRYQDKVVWIDARSVSDFELNHLIFSDNRMFPVRKGAEMERLLDAALGRMMEAQERGECVVVFCKGDCGAAEEIAREIRALGLVEAPVYTLEGGWDALRAAGMLTQ